MTTSVLSDAFGHHVWATERLIDACAVLTPEQLTAAAPGTFGSIIDTLRHLVSADSWYLSFYDPATRQLDEAAATSLAELRSVMTSNGAAWTTVLAGDLDPDADVVEHGDTGWEFHATTGIRLAQVVHHGTDHRSQVCTALSSLGVTPPGIDVWDYAEATGRSRDVAAPTP
jgi:uncharacterized damage-inducible protein DinB